MLQWPNLPQPPAAGMDENWSGEGDLFFLLQVFAGNRHLKRGWVKFEKTLLDRPAQLPALLKKEATHVLM